MEVFEKLGGELTSAEKPYGIRMILAILPVDRPAFKVIV
jgi:hypothetical protein